MGKTSGCIPFTEQASSQPGFVNSLLGDGKDIAGWHKVDGEPVKTLASGLTIQGKGLGQAVDHDDQ